MHFLMLPFMIKLRNYQNYPKLETSPKLEREMFTGKIKANITTSIFFLLKSGYGTTTIILGNIKNLNKTQIV